MNVILCIIIFSSLSISFNAYARPKTCNINKIESHELNTFFKRNYTINEWCRTRHISLRNLNLKNIPNSIVKLTHIRSLSKYISQIKKKQKLLNTFHELSDSDMDSVSIERNPIKSSNELQAIFIENELNEPAKPNLNEQNINISAPKEVIINVYLR